MSAQAAERPSSSGPARLGVASDGTENAAYPGIFCPVSADKRRAFSSGPSSWRREPLHRSAAPWIKSRLRDFWRPEAAREEAGAARGDHQQRESAEDHQRERKRVRVVRADLVETFRKERPVGPVRLVRAVERRRRLG